MYNHLYVYQVEKTAEPKIPFGYRYLVQTSSMAHTAFHTEAGLKLWASERGLVLPERDSAGELRGKITGEYGRRYFMDEAAFYSLQGQPILALDNGDYTLGIVTSENGLKWVNVPNPNVRQRPVFDYKTCRKFESLGVNPFASILSPQAILEAFRQAFRSRVLDAEALLIHFEMSGEAESLCNRMKEERRKSIQHNRALFLDLCDLGLGRDNAYMLARRTGAGDKEEAAICPCGCEGLKQNNTCPKCGFNPKNDGAILGNIGPEKQWWPPEWICSNCNGKIWNDDDSGLCEECR